MKRSTRTVLLALAFAAPVAASAGDEVGHWYLNPYVGGISADSIYTTKGSDLLYGIGFGRHLSENWSLEANLNTARLKDKYDGDHFRLSGLTFDLLRVFRRDSVFAPYISAGVGAVRYEPGALSVFDGSPAIGNGNQTGLAAEAGLGAFVKLWENGNASRSLSLRPDVKARWDNIDARRVPLDLLYTLGLTFSFGPGVTPPAPPAPPVAAAPPPPPPPPPPPAPVSKCPGTPAGVAVDADGCPIKDVVLEGVNFETNSAQLTGASRPILDKVADGLRQHPHLKVEIQGHTDSTGSAKYNLGLSDRRAASVREYLISQGVPAAQLTERGYGETQPVANNATAAGRLSNRRVVMHVLDNPGDVPVKKAGTAAE
ncbi:MAG: OmpA family protein [Proteobacteria bacterium]|nr:OmpA family protein [Pseudomonadota bacterium]